MQGQIQIPLNPPFSKGEVKTPRFSGEAPLPKGEEKALRGMVVISLG
jgi:hypothetical protein